MTRSGAPNHAHVERTHVERVRVSAFRIPTDAPESDGTLAWDHTVLVCVELDADGVVGLGYTYADASTARLIDDTLSKVVLGHPAMDVIGCFVKMGRAVRNLGRQGIASMAISAVDVALWDLKARLLDVSLSSLLGAARHRVAVYGSGGFTSYDANCLEAQLGEWAARGFSAVKMKIGSHPEDDVERVRLARAAIGPKTALFVDANGAYDAKGALGHALAFGDLGVTWFEEPVSSDDLDGLRFVRERVPATMDVAAGEYGYDARYFVNLLGARAVDVVQADATRCGGITGFLEIAALCDAHGAALSAHCAPSLHATLGCACPRVRHLEYFHDHVRLEHLLFEGVLDPIEGCLIPDRRRSGLGLTLRHGEAARFSIGSTSHHGTPQ